jgi:hypothetical protein
MILGGKSFSEKVLTLKEGINSSLFNYILPFEKGIYRKLSRVDDKEYKTRVIAILDYFSQSVLKPLHDYLFNILKKIPQDKTFSQGDFNLLFNNSEENYYYSVDLSNATDRFPMILISKLLKSRFPEQYVNS